MTKLVSHSDFNKSDGEVNGVLDKERGKFWTRLTLTVVEVKIIPSDTV